MAMAGTCDASSKRSRWCVHASTGVDWLESQVMSAESVQALVTATVAVLAGLGVISLARRQLLTFRYAAGWCLLLLLTALSGVLIPLTRPVARALSTTPGVLISTAAIAILVLICIQLSVSISGLQKQVQKLAEDSALSKLESEIRSRREVID